MRVGSTIILHLSKLWKAKFFILCDVIFLVRLQEKFDIDHSWEWNWVNQISHRWWHLWGGRQNPTLVNIFHLCFMTDTGPWNCRPSQFRIGLAKTSFGKAFRSVTVFTPRWLWPALSLFFLRIYLEYKLVLLSSSTVLSLRKVRAEHYFHLVVAYTSPPKRSLGSSAAF